MQRSRYQSAARNLHHCTQADALLAEQQAIFDSSPLGIAMTDDGKRVIKCNMRLGELLGCRMQNLVGS